MKRILYGNLVGKSRPSLQEEGEGDIMTKAILDVDDCVEGCENLRRKSLTQEWHLLGYCNVYNISGMFCKAVCKVLERCKTV